MNNTRKSANSKGNLIYIILTIIFIILAGIAIFLFFQIVGTETFSSQNTKKQSEQNVKAAVTPAPSTVSAVLQTANKILRNTDFYTEYLNDMDLKVEDLDKAKKYLLIDKEITYEITIGTDWTRVDTTRNFNDKKNTINNIPSYNYSDYFSYIGFDFIAPNTKKYVSIKCSYDSNNQTLLDKCYSLVNTFNIIDNK